MSVAVSPVHPACAPLLSVVVPAFNQARWIGRCLQSLQAQAMGDFEVWVVDDGSSDGTAELVKAVAQQDARFKLLVQKNAGAGAARNLGLRHAQGQYVHFLDSDDWLEPDAYRVWADAAQQHPQAQVLFANHVEVDLQTGHRTRVDVQNLPDGERRFGLGEGDFAKLLTTAVMPWNRWISRSFMLEHGVHFDEIPFANDRSCHYRLIKHLEHPLWCGQALVNYQVNNPESLVGQMGLKRVQSVLHALGQIHVICQDMSPQDQDKVFAKNVEDLALHYLKCPINERLAMTQAIVQALTPLAANRDLQRFKNQAWYPVWQIFWGLSQCGQAGRVQALGSQQVIPLVFAVNDAYLPFLNVALTSISQNLDEGWQAMAYVFHLGLTPERLQWMARDFDFCNIQICPVDLSALVALDAAHTPAHYSAEIYLRLWIPELLRAHEKVLYLDADLVVRKSVHHLYAVDVSGFQLAGVRDFNNAQHKKYVESALGVSADAYINSGVLLFNIRQCLEEKFRAHCFAVLTDEVRFNCPDQDMINMASAGRIKLLDSGWNYLWHYGFAGDHQPPDGQAWYEQDLRNAQRNKFIIHYSSAIKPWVYPDLQDAELFWAVARSCKGYPYIISAAARAKLRVVRGSLKLFKQGLDECNLQALTPVGATPPSR